jgi:predicted DCC family thiol-disulfide oxidoreductase YuxK
MSATDSRTQDVVVYDGDCGICEASARWITSHVPGLRVVSHLAHGLDRIDAVLFVTTNATLEGSVAVAAILRRARSRFLRMVGAVMGLPGVRRVASVVYSLIARNRRHLSRMLGLRACALDVTGTPDTTPL